MVRWPISPAVGIGAAPDRRRRGRCRRRCRSKASCRTAASGRAPRRRPPSPSAPTLASLSMTAGTPERIWRGMRAGGNPASRRRASRRPRAASEIHRTAEADAAALEAELALPLARDRHDLLEHPVAAALAIRRRATRGAPCDRPRTPPSRTWCRRCRSPACSCARSRQNFGGRCRAGALLHDRDGRPPGCRIARPRRAIA